MHNVARSRAPQFLKFLIFHELPYLLYLSHSLPCSYLEFVHNLTLINTEKVTNSTIPLIGQCLFSLWLVQLLPAFFFFTLSGFPLLELAVSTNSLDIFFISFPIQLWFQEAFSQELCSIKILCYMKEFWYINIPYLWIFVTHTYYKISSSLNLINFLFQ